MYNTCMRLYPFVVDARSAVHPVCMDINEREEHKPGGDERLLECVYTERH